MGIVGAVDRDRVVAIHCGCIDDNGRIAEESCVFDVHSSACSGNSQCGNEPCGCIERVRNRQHVVRARKSDGRRRKSGDIDWFEFGERNGRHSAQCNLAASLRRDIRCIDKLCRIAAACHLQKVTLTIVVASRHGNRHPRQARTCLHIKRVVSGLSANVETRHTLKAHRLIAIDAHVHASSRRAVDDNRVVSTATCNTDAAGVHHGNAAVVSIQDKIGQLQVGHIVYEHCMIRPGYPKILDGDVVSSDNGNPVVGGAGVDHDVRRSPCAAAYSE